MAGTGAAAPCSAAVGALQFNGEPVDVYGWEDTHGIPSGGSFTMRTRFLDYPGKYALVDHALSRATKGLIGILEVEGKPDDTIIKDKSGDSRKQLGEMKH